MNIREFAAKCGISPAAASRILNYSLEESQASRETYRKVRSLAAELGFRPNYAAKTLHTRRSRCIGVIIGFPVPVNTTAVVREISDYVYEHEYSLTVATCKNDPQLELKAFDTMLYRGVDAILWLPVSRRGGYQAGPIAKMLADAARLVPVVCLSYNDLPGVFKFKSNAAEDAASAAMRQLQLGCKRFGVIRRESEFLFHEVSRMGYVDCLRRNGIPSSDIVEVVPDLTGRSADWAKLAQAQGLWVYFLFRLHAFLPQLRRVCNLKQLHIDGQSFLEDYALSQWTYAQANNGESRSDLFGSLQYHLVDAGAVARRGAEIALQAIADPKLRPFTESVLWQDAKPDIDPADILFHW